VRAMASWIEIGCGNSRSVVEYRCTVEIYEARLCVADLAKFSYTGRYSSQSLASLGSGRMSIK
jgi:hypothetical protein